MIGYNADPVKQRVINRNITENISLRYANKRCNLMIGGAIEYYASHSDNQILQKNNYGSAEGMFKGSVVLPFNFQLLTDFNVIKRFGYIENSMNDINYIWNASLEYLIQKGTWRISLDAKDILNQNKGINYYVNASGRTQTLNTVLPRYLMLSLHYRFDFKPKKRAK
ncbi:MAG: outer membrane beta-barrel protein [Bacteroides sp.]|nr:outer membrane beta-barrel protein [Bacteroides sp.]